MTYPLHHCGSLFVTVPWKPVVFMFCGLMSRAPEGSAGSGSGLKVSELKTGPRLKVSSDRLEDVGN